MLACGGVLACQGVRHPHAGKIPAPILVVFDANRLGVALNRPVEGRGEKGGSVPVALVCAHGDLVALGVEIVHAEASGGNSFDVQPWCWQPR